MDERCNYCTHATEDQSEYHFCHVCEMDHDCFKPRTDKDQGCMEKLFILTDKYAYLKYKRIIKPVLQCDAIPNGR